jgi:hypothetical protein
MAGRYRLRLWAAAGDRVDYRTVELVVAAATGQPAFAEAAATPGPTAAPESSTQSTNPVRLVLISVIVISGLAFLAGTILLVLRRS